MKEKDEKEQEEKGKNEKVLLLNYKERQKITDEIQKKLEKKKVIKW